ncbi:hypothetical protein BOTBODRAFT_178450 [Botryobasidium botryosum FD-172 SS1]|uniref:Uncharacterized protein n=1 Tax=Botryobasidium botryosum (strain FD-172 SS1) TaxID=930990 RepID=A0A067MDV9_BOTB1|nr:hypothetical protein BOTBODRAFT_178450 [Botryobasidium botryosum FD-172 SS1]
MSTTPRLDDQTDGTESDHMPDLAPYDSDDDDMVLSDSPPRETVPSTPGEGDAPFYLCGDANFRLRDGAAVVLSYDVNCQMFPKLHQMVHQHHCDAASIHGSDDDDSPRDPLPSDGPHQDEAAGPLEGEDLDYSADAENDGAGQHVDQ